MILGGTSLTEPATATGTLTVSAGGTVEVGGTLRIHNGDTVRLQAGGTIKTHSLDPTGGGSFQFGGGTLSFTGNVTSNITVPATGTLTGTGTLLGNLTNVGKFAPGQSAGNVTIQGYYTQQGAATLEIEIGGASPGDTHDFVNITSSANIFGGSKLQLALLGGFIPGPSDTFTVLNAVGGISGVFSNITSGLRLDTVDGLGSFLVHYGVGSAFNQNQIVLSAFQPTGPGGLPGDFNHDGVVNAADYVVWRKGVGVAPTQDNYNLWRSNFGQTFSFLGSGWGAGGSSDNVPEPAAIALMLFATASLNVRLSDREPLQDAP